MAAAAPPNTPTEPYRLMAHHTLLVDADYVERVAFDLIVNFERMLGRRIPPAPLADWLDYVALDGGLLPAEGEAQTADNEIRVYFIHRPETAQLQNFNARALRRRNQRQGFCRQAGRILALGTCRRTGGGPRRFDRRGV